MKLVATLAATVSAHARLMEPPGRSSLYLFPNDPDVKQFWDMVVPNYADNQLFCGGLSTEIENGYKCGVCGDNYADARPRENELGGKYDAGIIPRQFKNEATIPLVVQVTAHHQGWFEFRLCAQSKDEQYENEDCFSDDKSLLTFTDGTTRHYITDTFPMRPGKGGYWYEMEAYLPSDLECDHCVLQWRYHCANSWGSDETGSGLGKGYQEEFYGCADISVKNKNVKPTQAPTTKTTTTEKTPDVDSFCSGKSNELFPYTSCNQYLQCANGRGYIKTCPEGLNYNSIGYCDWPENVVCVTNPYF